MLRAPQYRTLQTRGLEIWRDTEGLVTHYVLAMGTTGRIMGTSLYLKEQNFDVLIIGAQLEESSSISGLRSCQIFGASHLHHHHPKSHKQGEQNNDLQHGPLFAFVQTRSTFHDSSNPPHFLRIGFVKVKFRFPV
ncbi:hypothetical protein BST99_06025 [Aureicoccus marinus]|uniref:Tryptophan synthase beta chain-like PALP domain-containing protein n=1 Tax=Aureicoccus marinus TaxID=754435 RepID=A0A2S7T769_9FLAO|nr:hypothetical protein BST99_06025 [Aureicoccus marinus]